MTKGPIKNISASIHQRLMNVSRQSQRPFNDLVLYYAMERFLQRLAVSKYRDRFILKGALMLFVWNAPITRVTRDIDLLGRISNDLEGICAIIAEVCAISGDNDTDRDGLIFDSKSVTAEPIAEDADYHGVRAKFHGHLGNMSVSMQIDIGFSDIITPEATPITYPTIFGQTGPSLLGYNQETAVAEKFETMVKLGTLNTRMKDFFDIWLLAGSFGFDGRLLARAIGVTFNHRRTLMEHEPICFSMVFKDNPVKIAQWKGFAQRSRLSDGSPEFSIIVDSIRSFLQPVVKAVVGGNDFHQLWMPANRLWAILPTH